MDGSTSSSMAATIDLESYNNETTICSMKLMVEQSHMLLNKTLWSTLQPKFILHKALLHPMPQMLNTDTKI